MRAFLVSFLILFAAQTMASDNVIILLDTSGSMEERMKSVRVSRMKAAQDALSSVVDKIPADTNVGLLTFSGWVYPLGPVDKQALKKAINSTYPQGGTPLGQFTKVGADQLLIQREKDKYGTYRLIVVTDGEASDSGVLNKHLPEILGRGIIIDSIGVDMSSDHTLSKKSRSYMRADDPNSLTKALSKALAEVGTKQSDSKADFELIKGIPDKMAEDIIDTLTTHQNHGIGEPPPKKNSLQNGSSSYTSPEEQPATGISFFRIVGIVLGVFFSMLVMFLLRLWLTFHVGPKERSGYGRY